MFIEKITVKNYPRIGDLIIDMESWVHDADNCFRAGGKKYYLSHCLVDKSNDVYLDNLLFTIASGEMDPDLAKVMMQDHPLPCSITIDYQSNFSVKYTFMTDETGTIKSTLSRKYNNGMNLMSCNLGPIGIDESRELVDLELFNQSRFFDFSYNTLPLGISTKRLMENDDTYEQDYLSASPFRYLLDTIDVNIESSEYKELLLSYCHLMGLQIADIMPARAGSIRFLVKDRLDSPFVPLIMYGETSREADRAITILCFSALLISSFSHPMLCYVVNPGVHLDSKQINTLLRIINNMVDFNLQASQFVFKIKDYYSVTTSGITDEQVADVR